MLDAVRVLFVFSVLLSAASAHAQPKALGEAFAAYDRGEISHDPGALSGLVARDYVDWIHGMRDLRTGDITPAERAFKHLATLRTDIPLFESVDALRWTGPTPRFQALAAELDRATTAQR